MTRKVSLKFSVAFASAVALTIAIIAPGSISAPAGLPPASPEQPQREVLNTETVTVTPTGFEPSELTLPKKGFFLVIANRSGLDSVTLRLTHDAGERVFEVEVPSEQLDWGGEVTAPPGQYVLTEAGHPDWACRITVTN
jgi:hypothetical protein